MRNLKKGFYTALGTPVDNDGNIVAESLKKEIDMQIDAGASGLLLMGSMGMEASIKDEAFVSAVKIASEANKGRVPLFVGAMDNSVARVKDRINAIKDYDFDAVVLTTPFYFATGEDTLIKFFEDIADYSSVPVFLYDLPGVTKQKITYSMVESLASHKNILGIKTGDMVLARQIKRADLDFEVLFSNIDCFDIAVSYGIDKVLDGMFSCCPTNGKKFAEAVNNGDLCSVTKHLDNILYLRDEFIKYVIFPSFTAAMNLLGMDGSFSPDYMYPIADENISKIKEALKKIGEI